MFGWLWRQKKPESQLPTLVRWDEREIIIEGDHGEIGRFLWDSIGRIVASKQDLFVVDCIWLAFAGDAEGDECLGAVHEDAIGYRELVDEIGRRYPDQDPAWWSKVAFPAFATNSTIVWQRPKGAGAPEADSED